MVYILAIASLLSACTKENDLADKSVVESNAVKRSHTELDEWILNNLTLPYGIEVKYRWERNDTREETYTYPPESVKVKAVLETIKELWIDLFTAEENGGKGFMKGKAPVRIHMYGGQNIDNNGMELLYTPGTVASEMHLYNVNQFDPRNKEEVSILMRSVYHQFAKRLMEIYPYDRDKFLSISEPRYTNGDTELIKNVFKDSRSQVFGLSIYAHKRGFLTYHSFLSAEDDFAEIISAMLSYKAQQIGQALKSVSEVEAPENGTEEEKERWREEREEAKQAHAELTQKIAFVNNYFERSININLNRMQMDNSKRMRNFFAKKQ